MLIEYVSNRFKRSQVYAPSVKLIVVMAQGYENEDDEGDCDCEEDLDEELMDSNDEEYDDENIDDFEKPTLGIQHSSPARHQLDH